jgi:RNA polymerase sigma-70 factor (ECF subfamily)
MDWERLRSDDEMVQGDIAAGNFRAALETLVRGYQHVMVGFCTNMLGDADQAEEVAQEVFLAVYTAMPAFRRQASVRTWLFAIARRQCLKALRNRRRRRHLERDRREVIAETAHRQPPLPPGEDLETQVQLVRQSLNQLKTSERALLMMRYDTGLSMADMAHILGLSLASVRRRLVRALQRLREVVDGGTR